MNEISKYLCCIIVVISSLSTLRAQEIKYFNQEIQIIFTNRDSSKFFFNQPSMDTLYFDIGETFTDDKLEVFIDKKKVYSKKITTDTRYHFGRTDYFKIRIKKPKTITIRLNEKAVSIFYEKGYNVIDLLKGVHGGNEILQINLSNAFGWKD